LHDASDGSLKISGENEQQTAPHILRCSRRFTSAKNALNFQKLNGSDNFKIEYISNNFLQKNSSDELFQ